MVVLREFMPSRISIRDVARQAGVSHTTVSLSLRNDPRILPATRKRIARLAAKLGYRRDAVVGDLMARLRTLRARPAHATMGFITAWPTRAGWRVTANHDRFYSGVKARATELGYALDEFWLNEPGMTPARMTSILRTRGVKGLILCSLPESGGQLTLAWQYFACVTKGLTVAAPAVHRVVSSHYDDMQLAISKVRQRGYERLGFVLGQSHDLRVGRAWLAAFCLHQNEIEPVNRIPPLIIAKAESNPSTVFSKWITSSRPDVIFYAAQPVQDWLAENEWKVPRDIGLVNLDWSPDVGPITGINSDPETLGFAAVDLLVGQLQAHEYGIPRREKVVEVMGRWVEGKSLLNSRE